MDNKKMNKKCNIISTIPIPQCGPSHPGWHRHWNDPAKFKHWAPFKHGEYSKHSSSSEKYVDWLIKVTEHIKTKFQILKQWAHEWNKMLWL